MQHPNAASGQVLASQRGRGTVYSLRADTGRYALKVFKPKFRRPELAAACGAIAQFQHLPGVKVCRRYCLTKTGAPRPLATHPELDHAILMPWIEGPSWFEVILSKQPLAPAVSRDTATSLAYVLARLENAQLAHCDLSPGNVILEKGARPSVELVDIEEIYMPGQPKPRFVPEGTPGYQHVTSAQGQWAPEGDRFAAGILLSEMLGWANSTVVEQAYGESYFDPQELQTQGSTRYQVLHDHLRKECPKAAVLLERAWGTARLADCPTLGEWYQALRDVEWQPLPEAQRPAAPAVFWEGPAVQPAPVSPLQPEFVPLPHVNPEPLTVRWQQTQSETAPEPLSFVEKGRK